MKKSTYLYAALAVAALAVALVPGLLEGVQAASAQLIAYIGPENLAVLSLAGTTATTITKDVAYTGFGPMNTQPISGRVGIVPIPINFPLLAPVANDTHALCKLMPGVLVIDYDIFLDDVDSGTPAAAMSFGELNSTLADLAVVYQSGITIGQTGGLARFAAATQAADLRTLGATNRATERVLGLKWTTASATYTASKTGLLVLKVIG